MKIALTASCLALALACSGSSASEPTAQRTLLRGSDCLAPADVRNWIEIDDRTLLVDGGRLQYLVKLTGSCKTLGYSQALVFRGDPVSERVCGGLHDAVITRDYPCNILSLEILDKDQYREILHQHESSGKQKQTARKSKSP